MLICFQFLDLETTLASPSDENLTILTEFSSLQLANVVRFASKGLLPILNENVLADEFLSFGIDLSRFNLVPDVEKSVNLDWPEDDCLESKLFLPIVVKTEDVVISENEFDENVEIILKKKSKRKVKAKMPESEFKVSTEKNLVESDSEGSTKVQSDEDEGPDQHDPDFELEAEPLRPKRKYNKKKKSGDEAEEATEQKKIRLK